MAEPFEIEVRTRHGELVRADVYLPPHGDGRYPTLFAASPYQKALRHLPAVWTFPFVETGPIDFYLDRGYAYVWADVPGSGRSEGIWDPVSRREGEALHDVIEWVARQGWSTGSVGMIGQSYLCWSAWNVARTRPPHLRTIVAYDGATDMYRDWMYQGGIPALMFPIVWVNPVLILNHRELGHDIWGGERYRFLINMWSHRLDDDWHRSRSPFWELDQVDIPVLSIGVWGKRALHLRGNFLGFERVRGPKQLLVAHPETWAGAQRLFASEEFHERELLPWYEHHLKGIENGVMERPAVRFFVQGEGRYHSAPSWPPPDAGATVFYLSGSPSGTVRSLNDGSLTEEPPTIQEDRTSWSYPDPMWVDGTTTYDERGQPDVTARVITYTSPPFERDREFTGYGVLVLFASTDQRDMDVMAKLNVITPDPASPARVRRATQGWLRASHRREDPELTTEMRPFHSHQQEELLEPGRVYELRLELLPMSFLVRAGERLRLELSNHDSPITDSPSTHYYGLKVGTDTYHHDVSHPSRLILPERPRG
ncbi:MAG TPA: CocE/NonD family hydrolase [Candidatus Dormibacteraeota bacterium]|nr:CocE/NonD family hydrolase [Candidatus Dormibacteraeota bacterium]